MLYFKLFLLALIAFIPLDLLWLGWLARDFYRRQLGSMMREQTDWLAAGAFYLIFLAALVFFVVQPVLEGTAREVLLRGAFFGLATYATYDLVNRAAIANFPWTLVVVDIAWGILLCALVSWISWYFGR